MNQEEQIRHLGKLAGLVYHGLLDVGVPLNVAVLIVVTWMKEIGKQSPDEVIAETVKRLEETA